MSTTLTSAAPAPARPAEQSATLRRVSLLGIVLLLAAVTKASVTPLSDPDTWWHLRLGDLFMGPWSLQHPGRLTVFASESWVPTQWLTEVLASVFEQSFGLPGVVWLVTLACLFLTTTLYVTCRRESDVLAATLATAMSVLGMSASLSARPHLVTYLFLATTVAAWLRTCRDRRPRWWLVPLTWVWACSHGMWFTGPLVGLAVTLGLAMDRRLDARKGAALAAVPFMSVLAAALTPVGPKLLLAPFAVNEVTPYITEWAAPSFRETAPGVTAVMIALVAVTWARKAQVPWTHVALLALAAGWTLLSARTVTLGALMVAPLLAGTVQSWLTRPTSLGMSRREASAVTTALIACLVAAAMLAPRIAASPANVPSRFDAELARLPAGAVVLNSEALGGWLHWRHPALTPVVDGLSESFSVTYIERYLRAATAAEGWQQYVASTRARVAVLPQGSSLASALHEHAGWVEVESDEGYVLLRAPRGRQGEQLPSAR